MYQTAPPPDSLKKYIECFWFGELEHDTNHPYSHHAIASSRCELLFQCQGNFVTYDPTGRTEKVFDAGFYGQTNSFKHYYAVSKRSAFFGVRFFSHAFPIFFKIPAKDLTNQSLDISTLLGNKGNELTEQIFGAKLFSEKIHVITRFLENNLRRLDPKLQSVEQVLLSIHQQKGQVLIRNLVNQSFLSQRQFERHFQELTGFSAKAYLKIRRFENFVDAITSARSLSPKLLTEVAIHCGYYDQAHLNHHFKDFTGTTPSLYFQSV